ncbi:MAG: MarC family protein [Propionibacteriaceae bacterium]|nr:MarC family protein [Propionibacteriaceae bacterium]
MELGHLWLTAFMAFFAMMNPLANLPAFISLTADDDASTARTIARRALLLALGIVVVFAVAGKALFELFGITLPALRVAGGLLVAMVGFHMVQGKQSSVHHVEDSTPSPEQRLGVAVSPLALPLLAGPGTIATAINLSAQDGWAGVAATVVAFAAMCAITFVVFAYGQPLGARLGPSVLGVITRLMGLILAVVGVQMLIEGSKGAFPVLTR